MQTTLTIHCAGAAAITKCKNGFLPTDGSKKLIVSLSIIWKLFKDFNLRSITLLLFQFLITMPRLRYMTLKAESKTLS